MWAWPPLQLWRGKTEHVAAGFLDVDYLSSEFSELGADLGLGDQLTSADRADTFQRTKRRREARRFWTFKTLDPIRDSAAEFLNLALVFDEPLIVCHVTCSSLV